MVECLLAEQNVVGSSPTIRSEVKMTKEKNGFYKTKTGSRKTKTGG